MKGITFYEEDREPTLDNPNNIISIGVDERVANYISRLENKLEEKDKEIKELKNTIDKAIEEIDDILYYWCELCEVEWVELRIEDFTNIFKKLKSILEGEDK